MEGRSSLEAFSIGLLSMKLFRCLKALGVKTLKPVLFFLRVVQIFDSIFAKTFHFNVNMMMMMMIIIICLFVRFKVVGMSLNSP
jgi:hypothetical protein